MSTKQKNAGFLSRAQDAFELRRLNAAFLATMKHLKCRPEPRWRFDGIAAEDGRRHHPGADAVADCRTVLRAAVATGDRTIINATRREIAHYFEQLGDAAVAEVLPDEATSLDETLIGFHRESAEALTAVTCAGIEQTGSSIEKALRELREADDEGERLQELLAASIQRAQGQRAMRVVSR